MAAQPVLHVLAGPNGAGKTTLATRVILPATGLVFINADEIVLRDGLNATDQAYEASARAAAERDVLLASRTSFVTETVFSHPSKVQLLQTAKDNGYRIVLHVVLVPADLSVARVNDRVRHGGHAVAEEKIRQRHARLWAHVAEAITIADEVHVYDNSRAATPLRLLARFERGSVVGTPTWPVWAPGELTAIIANRGT